MLGEPSKYDNRIVGRGEANCKAVDCMPTAVGGQIVVHQRVRQVVNDDLAVQFVEIPFVLKEQRANLPLELKSLVAIVHVDELYPIKRMSVT